MAALVNGGRFRARASFRDMIKSRGAIGGGGGGEADDKDDAVSKLIDKYGDQMGEVGFGGVVGFCRCVSCCLCGCGRPRCKRVSDVSVVHMPGNFNFASKHNK